MYIYIYNGSETAMTHTNKQTQKRSIRISFTALNLDERRSETYTDAGLKPAVLATDNASK